jgi:hypothetical protein
MYAAYHGVAISASGVPVPNASIEVRKESDGSLATLFQDQDGSVSQPQGGSAFQTDANGAFVFFAAADDKGFRITISSGATADIRNVSLGTMQLLDYTAFSKTLVLAASAAAARTLLASYSSAEVDALVSNAIPGTRNVEIAASAAAGALTIALKSAAGTDHSSSDEGAIIFRDQALTSGNTDEIAITSAKSLVIPSTALMGVTANVPFKLWILAINDAGSLRVAAVKAADATSIMSIRNDTLLTATLVGTGSDSAKTVYADTAVASSRPVRVLGYMEWSAGLAVAGTWVVPTKIQPFFEGMPLPGQFTGNVVSTTDAAGSSTSSTSLVDVTGSSVSITPTLASNAVLADYGFTSSVTNAAATNNTFTRALLRGSTTLSTDSAGALSTGSGGGGITFNGGIGPVLDFPGSTSAQTYKLQHSTNSGSASVSTSSTSAVLAEVMT